MAAPTVQLVMTHCPSVEVATAIARAAVEQRLAACASILGPCRSIYVWQGKLEDEAEVPLLLKTTAEAFTPLSALIRQHHPYELPEILAVDIAQGLPAYLDWVAGQVAASRAGD